MKIVILADSIDVQNAGIHKYTYNIVKALLAIDQKHEYVLIKSKYSPEFESARQIIIPQKSFIGYKSLRFFVEIPRAVRTINPNIVFEPAHFGPFNIPSGIKRVNFVHDITPILFPHLHQPAGHILQRIFLRSILRRSNSIITNSNYTKADLIKHFPFTEGIIDVTYLGYDNLFHPNRDSQLAEDLEAHRPYFLIVGTIEPRKNLIVLLDAFERFRDVMEQKYSLLIAGAKGWKSGGFYRRLESHKYKSDIHLLGYMSEESLVSLYSNCEAFIYPSLYEGFGIPIVEAMACQRPIITSNSSSMPEVGGNAALYIDPTNPRDLCDKMLLIVNDGALVNRLIANGKERVKLFSWRHAAKKTLDIFEKLND